MTKAPPDTNLSSPQHILCTGGAGYIGSHTVIRLLQLGFTVTVVDNLCDDGDAAVKRLENACDSLQIQKPRFVHVDLLDFPLLQKVFDDKPVDAVIHYAGLKSVGESVQAPLKYYKNNLVGMMNLIEAMEKGGCRTLVFSSSATVYKPSNEPIKETDPLGSTNPYGQTKLMIEQLLQDIYVAKPNWRISVLRYFNPIGAHSSGYLGELPKHPQNLLPVIQQVAGGRRKKLSIFGDDWHTPDGTGVRDYIHIEDLVEGHVAALAFIQRRSCHDQGIYAVHNLGTGKGASVLEMVHHFEAASQTQIPIEMVARRPGDLGSVVADPTKANKELHWKASRTIRDACVSAWNWQQQHPEVFGPQ